LHALKFYKRAGRLEKWRFVQFMRDKIFTDGFWFAIKSWISSNFAHEIYRFCGKVSIATLRNFTLTWGLLLC